MFSGEFSNKDANDEGHLRVLYETVFNRPPDSAGFQGWLYAMKKGVSRDLQ